MSIISLEAISESTLSVEDVRGLAAELNMDISKAQDAEDYLVLLKSFEAVMQQVENAPDFIHPSLVPHPVVGDRAYWKPDAKENPLNAWSHRCELKSANPVNSMLAGRTMAVKDNICIAGLPTTLGLCPKLLSRDGILPTSPVDASVVSRILAAGAVVKGSSTCESYCASPLAFASATGPVHHPFLHGYTTGGSSSGSCALVAVDHYMGQAQGSLGEAAELGIGSDQAGSVRIPASFTGIYGLKPTFGLVPYTGAASMSPMIDHLGPIASNLEDIASLLKVIAGYDGLDPRMTPESPLPGQVKDYPKLLADFRAEIRSQGSSGSAMAIRVGLVKESFAVPGLSPEVRDMVWHVAMKNFGAVGVDVTEISIPMHLEGPLIWTASTRPSMSEWLCQGKPSGHLSHLAPHVRTQWPPDQEMYEVLTSINPAAINIMLSGQLANRRSWQHLEAKAHRKALELRAAYDQALESVDVLLTPCAPSISMPHPPMRDELGGMSSVMEKLGIAVGVTSNTCPFNVTGHPAMNTPCGFLSAPDHPDVMLPVGMQLIGRRWEDETVMLAAALFEEGTRLTRDPGKGLGMSHV
ncbi:putative amidase [Thozetella sp. PMI_491]|nr:putative amidase [Thozetella sp. PMI_491]